MSTCTDKAGSIIDVDCIYEDGKFIIGGTSCCLPEIFTIRFRAPADYKAGDVIVFRKEELPVRTPGMESASSDAFKAGAIVHADIDMVSQRAFVWLGSAGGGIGALPNLSYEEQFAGFYDWDGNKVYVKSVKIDSFPNGENTLAWGFVPHNIPNFNRLIDRKICYFSPRGNRYIVGNHAGENGIFSNIHITPENIELSVKNVDRRDQYGVAILYYTCTDR